MILCDVDTKNAGVQLCVVPPPTYVIFCWIKNQLANSGYTFAPSIEIDIYVYTEFSTHLYRLFSANALHGLHAG